MAQLKDGPAICHAQFIRGIPAVPYPVSLVSVLCTNLFAIHHRMRQPPLIASDIFL